MNEHAELIARLKEAAEEIGDDDFALAADLIRTLQMQRNAFAEAAKSLAADLLQAEDGEANSRQTKQKGKNPYKSAYFTGYAHGLRKGFAVGRAMICDPERNANETGMSDSPV